MKSSVSDKVMAVAVALFDGDIRKANEWYFEYPIPEFGGQTACHAVAMGREDDVLRLLDMYDAGACG